MTALVRIPTVLRPAMGGDTSVTVEGSTVGEVLDQLTENHPDVKGQLLNKRRHPAPLLERLRERRRRALPRRRRRARHQRRRDHPAARRRRRLVVVTRYASVLDLIGHTPIIDVSALSPKANVTILAKLEGRNPAGSVKDRVAVSLVDAAERDGLLIPGKPDQVLIEPSSGNTGIALAMVCRLRGYHLKVVLPSNVSPERRQLLHAWGAEIIDSPGAEGSNGAVRLAQSLSARQSRVDVPLPVRQSRQSRGALSHDRPRDPRGRPGDHALRRGTGNLGHADGRRALPARAPTRRADLGRRTAGRRDGRRTAQPRRRLHPADLHRQRRRGNCSTVASSCGRRSPSSGPDASPRSDCSSDSPRAPSWPARSSARTRFGDDDTATIVTIVADDGWKYLSTGAWSDDIDDVVERAKSIIYF